MSPLAETAREAREESDRGTTLTVAVGSDVAVDADAGQFRALLAETRAGSDEVVADTEGVRAVRTFESPSRQSRPTSFQSSA